LRYSGFLQTNISKISITKFKTFVLIKKLLRRTLNLRYVSCHVASKQIKVYTHGAGVAIVDPAKAMQNKDVALRA